MAGHASSPRAENKRGPCQVGEGQARPYLADEAGVRRTSFRVVEEGRVEVVAGGDIQVAFRQGSRASEIFQRYLKSIVRKHGKGLIRSFKRSFV